MKNIKKRDSKTKAIKTFNKSLIIADKTKDKLVSAKRKTNNISSEQSQNEYGDEKIKQMSKDTVIVSKEVIKNSPKNIKNTIDTSKKVSKKAKEIAKKATKKTKEAAKSTAKTTKAAARATAEAIKAMITSIKALITAIAAGGWIAILVILIVCVIGLICASIFGIFFSNETGAKSITTVIKETNSEVNKKIEDIKKKNKYDEINIESTYDNWNEVIAVYSVKYSEDGKYNITIIDKDNEKKLKKVFWDFNEIKSKKIIEDINDEETKTTLVINIESKSKEEIMKKYKFTEKEKEAVNELLSKKYGVLWSNLIYGSMYGNTQIVEIAKQQVGNVGGEPYWRWYGYNHRIEWCAVFVSWVANQAGVLNDKIPKFAGVYTGIEWFKSRGEWQKRGYSPRPGDIIFFDWENDGKPNHVGIVEKTEDGYIYTIEGNSTNDTCRAKKYKINSNVIYGFGLPNY